MKKKILLLSLSFASALVFAQRNCGTTDRLHRMMEKNPEIEKHIEEQKRICKEMG